MSTSSQSNTWNYTTQTHYVTNKRQPCGCTYACSCDWRAIGQRTMALIPIQWKDAFIEWVAHGHQDLYARDKENSVQWFLPRDFHLVRVPVGA